MENKELQGKLEEVKTLIIKNSKDAHWAKNAISELLSLKGMLDLQPLQCEDIGEVIDSFEGNTFILRKHQYGVSYHQYNSMDVRIRANITSAYDFICSFIDYKDEYKNLSEEEKAAFDITLSAIGYILSIPTYVFIDETFFFDLAASVVKFLREKTEEALDTPLKEETGEDLEKNELFKEAVLGMEELAESTKDSE